MAEVTRRIGLSLGADVCWPLVYEDLLRELDLQVQVGNDSVRFECERVTIEPFDLRQEVRYDLVIDRLTHWYGVSREWIKKAILLNDLYVFNNPWSVQSMEKQTSYCAMMRLGLHIPDTWLLPPKDYEDSPDLAATLERYAKLFDLGAIGDEMQYPLFMKPYDGGGWVGVSKIDDAEELRSAYDESGKFVMHLQKGIVPYERFVRCVAIGPQVRVVDYDPTAALHDRYVLGDAVIDSGDRNELEDITLTINSFFGWDFNSCEMLARDGIWHPIDFANPCPDSQVTSLHYHWPWLVTAKLRWSLFCAAYRRPMRKTLDWEPFFEIERQGLPYRERLAAYAEIAHDRYESARFEDFCNDHLADLDRIAWEYFGGEAARRAIRAKVEALFPENEWDEFTNVFIERVETWRRNNPPAPR